MSGTWKPTIFQGQSLASQIKDTNREASRPTTEVRYQPIAPYGDPSHINYATESRRIARAW
jgi:hypothetical protein